MPKYTNSGNAVVSIGNLRLEPGESKSVLEFIPGTLPAGVTEDAATPKFTSIILAQKITGSTTITVPETYADPLTGAIRTLTGNYLISVYVGIGEATVQINATGTARFVGLYETYSIRCYNRVIDTLLVVPTGTTYVTIEAI
jgi:hypothetical protein